MAIKSRHLQIRLTPREKADLKRRAKDAGQDLSTFVMSRALPPARGRFAGVVKALSEEGDRAYPLAELNDFLSELAPIEFRLAVEEIPPNTLSPFLLSYVAAMVEVAAGQKDQPPPPWTAKVEGLDEPYFTTPLRSLRLHLLQSSPVPFKRRNLFVDSTVGARV
ncbi:MAG: hypothetical protein WEG36_07085 [Gemmatimonadota bacterium]